MPPTLESYMHRRHTSLIRTRIQATPPTLCLTATQVTPPSLNLTHTEAPPPSFFMETYRQRRTFFIKTCMHRSQEATPHLPRCTEALNRESTKKEHKAKGKYFFDKGAKQNTLYTMSCKSSSPACWRCFRIFPYTQDDLF